MNERLINHRQDKCPWINMHSYTWQEELSEPRRSGSVSGQNCVLDKQEMNPLPESIQKGISVSQSCLQTRIIK